MSLIEEILREAVDSNGDLGALLRKCKLLAARLGNKSLEDWLIWESNGYPRDISVPEYRTWPLTIKGHFSGPFGSGLRNVEVPIALLPQEVRDRFNKYECRQSIASMEQLLKGTEANYLTLGTRDLALALGDTVFEGQECLQAWAEFGKGHIYELFNSVRNRILDFSIAIWKLDPDAGDILRPLDSTLESSHVTQIINTTIYGGNANVIGQADNSIVTLHVHQGDLESLERVLSENSVSQKDIDELKEAINQDKQPVEKGKFGPKVSTWVSKMMKKAAEGTWTITSNVAGRLISEIISNYYGL